VNRTVVLLAALGATFAWLALLWWTDLPLGVPGEWTWARFETPPAALLWGATLAVLGGGPLLAVAWLGERRFERASPVERAGWLLLLMTAGCGWLLAIQEGSAAGIGLGKAPYVLYYRRTEGYFWQARYEVTSVRDFLQGYEKLLAERDYLHIGTHPPGLTLLYCGLLALLEDAPELQRLAETTQPESVRSALQLMAAQARGGPQELTPVDAAALWVATLLTHLATVLTIAPLYLWLRLAAPPGSCWRAVVWWSLVPALGVFLPKSDLLYPVIAMTAAWLWRRGWLRGGLIECCFAGAVLTGGLCLTLAFLPVALLLGVQSLCDGWRLARPPQLRGEPAGETVVARAAKSTDAARALGRSGLQALAAAIGASAVALLAAAWGLWLPSVWAWNVSNHALFYEHNVRTWSAWLLVNPLELLGAVGAPAGVAAIATATMLLRRRDWRTLRAGGAGAFAVVWSLLWLSGKNMGEAARLWILLLPWVVAAAEPLWRSVDERSTPAADSLPRTSAVAAGPPPPVVSADGGPVSNGRSNPGGRQLWLALLCLQAIAAAATILRVDGFHFTSLTNP